MTIEQRREKELSLTASLSLLVPEGFTAKVTLTKIEVRPSVIAKRIQAIVCDYFNLTLEALLSPCREDELVIARKFICYFVKFYTELSLKKIVSYAGRVDHATAHYHLKNLEDLIQTEDRFKIFRDELSGIIQSKFKP